MKPHTQTCKHPAMDMACVLWSQPIGKSTPQQDVTSPLRTCCDNIPLCCIYPNVAERAPCAFCGSIATPTEKSRAQSCSACKFRQYCNVDCQRKHWPVHKKQCKRLAQEFAQLKEFTSTDLPPQEKPISQVSIDGYCTSNPSKCEQVTFVRNPSHE